MALVECLCGYKYDGETNESCPVCGEPNHSFGKPQPAAPKSEKQLKDELLMKLAFMQLEEEEKLKKGDETITPSKSSIWEAPGVFWSIAGVIAVGLLIYLICISPQSRYFHGAREDFFISGWLFVSGAIAIYLGKLLEGIIDNRPFKLRPADGASPGSLGTTNNIGTTMLGGFRYYAGTCVSYEFVCFFIPLFPVGCYRNKMGATTKSGYKTTSTSYRFYGSEKMSGLEILQIYLVSWGWLPFVFGIIGLVIAAFE